MSVVRSHPVRTPPPRPKSGADDGDTLVALLVSPVAVPPPPGWTLLASAPDSAGRFHLQALARYGADAGETLPRFPLAASTVVTLPPCLYRGCDTVNHAGSLVVQAWAGGELSDPEARTPLGLRLASLVTPSEPGPIPPAYRPDATAALTVVLR